MSNEEYFLISNNEDGDVYLQAMNKEQVLKEIEERSDSADPEKYFSNLDILDFTNLVERKGVWIIKGKLIVPKEVVKIIKYEID